MRVRIDWCNVQRQLGQSPHLRCVIGYHLGRPCLVRGTAILATSPKQALEVIDELRAVRPLAQAA